MTTVELVKEKQAEIVRTARTHGALKLSLFGSVVRGEDSANSDIDFLVEFEEGRTLFDLIRLKQQLETLLGKPVDLVTEKSVHPLLRESILAEAVQV